MYPWIVYNGTYRDGGSDLQSFTSAIGAVTIHQIAERESLGTNHERHISRLFMGMGHAASNTDILPVLMALSADRRTRPPRPDRWI